MLPEQIPHNLRKLALFLPGMEEGEGAWPQGEALAVVDSLRGTTLAVSEVVVFESAPGGYVPLDRELSISRLPDEPDTDYARRSRSAAAEFIRTCAVDPGQALFAMTFQTWKEAA